MTPANTLTRIASLGLAAVSFSVLLVACGGGSNSAPTGVTPAASKTFAMGRISGFGSVVVNGVHYDDSHAIVKDEDGEARSQNDLRLGMVVEVEAGEIGEANNVRTATAQNISFSSLIRGPIESVGVGAVVVLGQTVNVSATTVFDESLVGGLAALKVGSVIRIYGTLDSTTGVYTATRIEPEAGAESYRLRGMVSALNPAAKTMTIGAALIDVSSVTLPEGLKAGSLVRVKLQTTQVNGAWVASSVKPGLFEPQDHDHSEVEGTITDFTSVASFSVDGLPVDASKATFEDGTAGIVKGARVEVEGAIVNGILMATKVELKSDRQDQQEGFDIEGAIASIDIVKSTFTIRGVTVSYAGSVTFSGGSAVDLTLGRKLEVRGTLAADGVTLNATEIKIELSM